jgi:hypothetical protein
VELSLTSGDYRHNDQFPGQLRSVIRPVALFHPSLTKFIEIKLMSFGFKHANLAAEKIIGFVSSVVRIYRTLCKSPQLMFRAFVICNNARRFLDKVVVWPVETRKEVIR